MREIVSFECWTFCWEVETKNIIFHVRLTIFPGLYTPQVDRDENKSDIKFEIFKMHGSYR